MSADRSQGDEAHAGFAFRSESPSHMHEHFLPHVFTLSGSLPAGTRVLDVGCGNGFTAGQFLARGCKVVGIDVSESGIILARKSYPQGRFEVMSADNFTIDELGAEPFDLVVSTEVIEHLYAPRAYATAAFQALRPGGRFVCSTPYHGYIKNLALGILNRWDTHMDPLWDGGHIKCWSRQTLSTLLAETGFVKVQFRGVGRVPALWMTMVMSGDKPAT